MGWTGATWKVGCVGLGYVGGIGVLQCLLDHMLEVEWVHSHATIEHVRAANKLREYDEAYSTWRAVSSEQQVVSSK